MAWTEERIEQLEQLWDEGLSTSEIAAKLDGVSRNAVIGKLHRIGLCGRGTPSAPAPKTHTDAPPTTKQGIKPFSSDVSSYLLPEKDGCKWPYGNPYEPDDFSYCGEGVEGGGSYCPEHEEIARA